MNENAVKRQHEPFGGTTLFIFEGLNVKKTVLNEKSKNSN
jgi:hypothetical protein